jgi:c-di-GMP-binding flagellar brake protein YcgR
MISFFERERRSYKRVTADFDLTYGPTPDEQSMTTGVEISEKGLSFRSSRALSSEVSLYIRLIVRAEDLPEMIEARVKHVDADIVGVEFTKVASSAKAAIAAVMACSVSAGPGRSDLPGNG